LSEWLVSFVDERFVRLERFGKWNIIGLGEVGGMVWVADELIELMDWVWLRGSKNGLVRNRTLAAGE
jgi:hypothetical protein